MSFYFFTWALSLVGVLVLLSIRKVELIRGQPLPFWRDIRHKTERPLRGFYLRIAQDTVAGHDRMSLFCYNKVRRPVLRFCKRVLHRSIDILTAILEQSHRRLVYLRHKKKIKSRQDKN